MKILAILICLAPLTELAGGEEPVETTEQSRLVFRISRQFIQERLMPTVSQETPVRRFLFGADVAGVANTTGKTGVLMDLMEDEALFTVTFKGTVINRTVATRRPVQIYSTGTTLFEAKRKIRFDGLHFVEEPVGFEASHSSRTDGIAAPFGLRGALARSVAARRVRETQPYCDAIALDDAKTLVVADFDKETKRLTQDLNRMTLLQQALRQVSPQAKDWIVRLRSTPEFIMISPGPEGTPIPDLPREWVRMKAPVELWVRGDAERKSVRGLVELWNTVGRQDKADKPAKVEKLVLTAAGDWWVLKLGEDLVENLIEKRENGKEPIKSSALGPKK